VTNVSEERPYGDYKVSQMSVGDDLYVGSFGSGPYDVILYWGASGATVVTFRCS